MSAVRELADQMLAAVSTKLKIAPGRLDAAGEALLGCVVDGARVGVRVVAHDANGTLALLVPVGSLAGDGPEGFAAALLAANFAGVGAQGLTFSRTPHDGTLYLGHTLLVPGATYAAFEAALARVISAGLSTRRRLAANPATALPPSIE